MIVVDINNLSKKEIREFTNHISKQPEGFGTLLLTEDQKRFYEDEHTNWNLIADCLKAYFQGKSVKKFILKNSEDYKGYKIIDHEFLNNAVKYWIALYSLLNEIWLEIDSYFVEENLELIFEEPIDAIKFLIYQKANSQFEICLRDYYYHSKKQSLKVLTAINKIVKKSNNGIVLEPNDDASLYDENTYRLKPYEHVFVKGIYKKMRDDSLVKTEYDKYLNTFKKVASLSSDTDAKNQFKEFKRIEKRMLTRIKSKRSGVTEWALVTS